MVVISMAVLRWQCSDGRAPILESTKLHWLQDSTVVSKNVWEQKSAKDKSEYEVCRHIRVHLCKVFLSANYSKQ